MSKLKFFKVVGDGATELFQLPETFITDSVNLISGAGVINEMGNEYIQITPAPALDAKVGILYSISESEALPGNKLDRDLILKLGKSIELMQETMVGFEKGLAKRVTHSDFAAFSSALTDEVNTLKAIVASMN